MKYELSDAEKQRHEEIVKIQNYLADGYSPTQICNLMHTTYKRIRIYWLEFKHSGVRVNTVLSAIIAIK